MRILFTLALLISSLGAEPSLPAISLIPEREMGTRRSIDFKQIDWKVDSEWFSKPAPVCRVSEKPMDVSKIHEQAKALKLTPVWNEIAEQIGSREDGAFYYLGEMVDRFQTAVGGNPKTHAFFFNLSRYNRYQRDADEDPIVKPLPTKEEAVKISREWMKKLGIDENLLYQHGTGPDGFDVVFRVDYEGGFSPKTKKQEEFDYGMTLNFSQQIGGLPSFWTHDGGTLECQIADGSEFSAMRGSLTGWEKIGDYPVLDKTEIEKALKEGFAWTDQPLDCEVLEISRIDLEAFHFRPKHPQKDFPLMYTFVCSAKGGPNDGKTTTLHMPALRQHRDKYGPLPEGTQNEDIPEWYKPTVPPFPKK